MIRSVIERCAAIDVGKRFLAVCISIDAAQDQPLLEVRCFGVTRAELVRLRQWCQSEGCTHIVMESTGCYWKPVLNVLEEDPEYAVEIVLANAQQVKGLTGHKTDPQDARWLAHLLRHGMIGLSGQLMLEALVQGTADEAAVAQLRKATRARRWRS